MFAPRTILEQLHRYCPMSYLEQLGEYCEMRWDLHGRLIASSIGGTVGAFVGWLTAEILLGAALEQAGNTSHVYALSAAYGIIVGMLIGLFIGIAEGLAHGTPIRLATNAVLGVWLGAIGGCVGMIFAESLFRILTIVKASIAARVFGWACFGAFVGSAQGIARGSQKGAFNSLLGGAVGGLIGGLSFEMVSSLLSGYSATSAFPRGIGLLAIGMLIGIFVALFEHILSYGTLKVISGRMEGKEFILDKPKLTIGRDERCDIPIYHDRDVMPKHAVLEWDGNSYKITPAGNANLVHRGIPVKMARLSHNDIIIVGSTKLIYRAGSAITTAPIASHTCPRCGVTNRQSAKFCNRCGSALPISSYAPLRRVLQLIRSTGVILLTLLILSGAANFLSLHTFASYHPARLYTSVTGAQIAVTPKGYDDIGQVLRELGEGYEFMEIGFDKLRDQSYLSRFQVVFINCSERCIDSEAESIAKSVRQYVESGGIVYASDWAAYIIQRAFPEHVRFAEEKGDTQDIEAKVTDESLTSIVGESLRLTFNATNWFPIDWVANDTAVHLIGDYQDMYGRIHEGKPLLVSFKHGNGFVIFTCFHNEPQLSEAEKKLLQFLVVRPITFELSERADSLLVAKRGTAIREFIGTISSGRASPLYKVTLKDEAALVIVLTWRGGVGNFEIQVQDDSGKLIHSGRGSNSPLTFETEKLQPGIYKVRLFALQAPLMNTPYAIRIGMR